MMRIACIGDTHFQHGHWRNPDRLAAADAAIADALAMSEIGAWVHLGDLWDGDASDEDLVAVADRLQRMAAVAPVLLLLGNHGVAGYSQLMARLRTRWPITVADAPGVARVSLATGDECAIATLPYPYKSVLAAAGTPVGSVGREAAEHLDVICMGLASALAAFDGPTLLVGHLTVAGATAGQGQPLGIERDVALSATALARFGASVPKVFGHIHKPQEVYGAWYAGSVAASDWGETEGKRWVLVEYDGAAGRLVSRPIATPSLYHVEGELTRDAFTWRVTDGPGGALAAPPSDWTGCDVRVRARYHESERDVLATARGRAVAAFAGARNVKFEPVAVPVRELRAPEVVAATSLPEKLAAWARLSGVAWSGEIVRCAGLLESEDGDAVVAAVAARLEPLARLDAQEVRA